MSAEIPVNKEFLKKTMNLVLELKLNKKDFDRIHEKFKIFNDDPKVKDFIEKISDIVENDDLKSIL